MNKIHQNKILVTGLLCWGIIFSPPRIDADVYIGALENHETLTKRVTQCHFPVHFIQPLPQTKMSIEWIETSSVQTLVNQAQSGFERFKFGMAFEKLNPVLQVLRNEEVYDSNRLEAEMLMARLAKIVPTLGKFYEESINYLAKMHLLSLPDPTQVPPDIYQDITIAVDRMNRGRKEVLSFAPSPTLLEVNGQVLQNQTQIRLSYETLSESLIYAKYDEIGWIQLRTDSYYIYPLKNIIDFVQYFPFRPDYIWSVDGQGEFLQRVGDQKILWRSQDILANVCELISTTHQEREILTKSNKRSKKQIVRSILLTSLFTSAILIGGGAWRFSKQPEETGSIIIRW